MVRLAGQKCEEWLQIRVKASKKAREKKLGPGRYFHRMANTCAEMQTDAPAENAEMRITKIEIPLTQRAALTPREFAAQFGRSQTWAYRLIYAGASRSSAGRGLIDSSNRVGSDPQWREIPRRLR